jgi:hypothetical protein
VFIPAVSYGLAFASIDPKELKKIDSIRVRPLGASRSTTNG